MKKRRSKKAVWINRLLAMLLAAGFFCLALAGYCFHLSDEIEKRFSSRRWRIPSKVLSGTTLLYPGQSINPDLFYDMLDRLGYRKVLKAPAQEGEYHRSESLLSIYLNDLNLPSRQRKGFFARIYFSNYQIKAIENISEKKPLPLLELEPEEIMVYFGSERERRRLVSISQVPNHVIHAVLAAEDSRFYTHQGMDPRGILRAIYTNLRHGSLRQGGSTITQQLAKNYFLTPEKTFSRKLKELFLALSMELACSKGDILEIYLNEIYFGQKGSVSVNGIGEAAFFYFGKAVENLVVHEAATIAGLIKAPGIYSPYADINRSKVRRDQVLKRMNDLGWISSDQLEASVNQPVSPVGYRKYTKKAPYFTDYLFKQFSELYSPEVLSSEGFTIYTTLDTQVQTAAEKALEQGLSRLEKHNPGLKHQEAGKKLQGAIVVMQPKTGYILAMVGGRQYSVSQFNRITQARRQPGSAFKPFVYLSGLDRYTPASKLSNESKSYNVNGRIWQPRNYSQVAETSVRLRDALARSINLAAVDLAVNTGLENIVSTAEEFGFSTALKPYPSIALGAFEVIPLELARGYCAFAADGLLPHPMSLKDVVDESGQVLQRRHMDITRVTSIAKAFLMNSLLQSVVLSGSAHSLKNCGITFPAAGKTGTTNDYKDAWFVGYTPDVIALVWVGFDDGSSIQATGASAALPIWALLMKALPQHISGEWFEMPPGVVKRTVCTESGDLAISKACPETLSDFFLAKNMPESFCRRHVVQGPVKKFFNSLIKYFKKD